MKSVAALQDVGGGIFFRSLSDSAEELGLVGQELLWDLKESASDKATIPRHL